MLYIIDEEFKKAILNIIIKGFGLTAKYSIPTVLSSMALYNDRLG
jgi:hypothetical protein